MFLYVFDDKEPVDTKSFGIYHNYSKPETNVFLTELVNELAKLTEE